MSTATAKQAIIGNYTINPSTPISSVIIPVGGSISAPNGVMTIRYRQSGNFIFGISATTTGNMFNTSNGSLAIWNTNTPNYGKLVGTDLPSLNATAEFVANALGKTVGTSFSSDNIQIWDSGTVNTVESSDVYIYSSVLGGVPTPISQTTLPPEPYLLDGILLNDAPHDSLVAFQATVSGTGAQCISFAKKTGNTYSDFFFDTNGVSHIVACSVNNLTDVSIVQLATSLGITPTSAVFATNTGGAGVIQSFANAGSWISTLGGGPITPYKLVSLTV